jgi:hypothetical protein
MRGRVPGHTDAEVIAVLFPDVLDEVIRMLEEIRLGVEGRCVLLASGRITSQGQDVLDTDLFCALPIRLGMPS